MRYTVCLLYTSCSARSRSSFSAGVSAAARNSSPSPVSSTHLDVYKRQGKNILHATRNLPLIDGVAAVLKKGGHVAVDMPLMNSKSNAQAMETEKIPRLLAQLAIPAVVAQIINLLYRSQSQRIHRYCTGNIHFTGSRN